MSANDLGRVKTPKSNLRIEISSRLRQFKEQQRWRPLLGVDNRENNSARSSCAYVFTQPRPIADIGRPLFELSLNVQSPPFLVLVRIAKLPCPGPRRRRQ